MEGLALVSLAAGVLTVAAPCVLPLLPIILTSALQGSRAGPLAMASGLTISLATVGVGVTAFGHLVGIDEQRRIAVSAQQETEVQRQKAVKQRDRANETALKARAQSALANARFSDLNGKSGMALALAIFLSRNCLLLYCVHLIEIIQPGLFNQR